MVRSIVLYSIKQGKILNNFILLTFFGFLYSCQSLETKSAYYSLIQVGKAYFPVDTLTKPIQINSQAIGDTLIVLNQERNFLLFYSISKEKLLNKISFDREGENGIPGITGFLYHNKDSIFILQSYQYRLYLCNIAGKIIDKYKLLNNDKLDANAALASDNMRSMMVKIGDEIHISTNPYLKPESKEYYQSKKIHQVLNLKKKTYKFLPITYSSIYQKNAYPHAFSLFFRTYNPFNRNFIYSFMADDRVMLTDGKQITYHQARCEQMKQPLKLNDFTYNEEEHLQIQQQSNFYLMILYDKYRNVYYRFAQKSDDLDKTKWVVIVLDEKLKKISESICSSILKKSESNCFLPPFIGEKGLYIHNPNSENEDFFEMDIYTLSKKE